MAEALFAVVCSQPFQNPTAHRLRGWGKLLREGRGAEIACDSFLNGARLRAPGANDDRRRLIHRRRISVHELGGPGHSMQRGGLMSRTSEVKPWFAVPIDIAVHVFRQMTHHTRSHSFASVVSPSRSVPSRVIIVILPALSISTRAICTPA